MFIDRKLVCSKLFL